MTTTLSGLIVAPNQSIAKPYAQFLDNQKTRQQYRLNLSISGNGAMLIDRFIIRP
jgi:hypothetical protein